MADGPVRAPLRAFPLGTGLQALLQWAWIHVVHQIVGAWPQFHRAGDMGRAVAVGAVIGTVAITVAFAVVGAGGGGQTEQGQGKHGTSQGRTHGGNSLLELLGGLPNLEVFYDDPVSVVSPLGPVA